MENMTELNKNAALRGTYEDSLINAINLIEDFTMYGGSMIVSTAAITAQLTMIMAMITNLFLFFISVVLSENYDLHENTNIFPVMILYSILLQRSTA